MIAVFYTDIALGSLSKHLVWFCLGMEKLSCLIKVFYARNPRKWLGRLAVMNLFLNFVTSFIRWLAWRCWRQSGDWPILRERRLLRFASDMQEIRDFQNGNQRVRWQWASTIRVFMHGTGAPFRIEGVYLVLHTYICRGVDVSCCFCPYYHGFP